MAVYDVFKRKGVDAVAIDVMGSCIDALTGINVDRVFNIIDGRGGEEARFKVSCR